MANPLRYAISGLGRRTRTTYLPVFTSGAASSRSHHLVAVVDADRQRLDEFRAEWPSMMIAHHVENLHCLLEEGRLDWLIVATPDYCHSSQILASLEQGVSIITEKPMALDMLQVRQISAAAEGSRAQVRVAHNLRFLNLHIRIKQLLADGCVGRVLQIRFDYHLTPGHGSSYFQRWHRRRAASGGLPITKSCHHFDLFNWWLEDTPIQVRGATSCLHFHAGAPLPDGAGATIPLDADIDDTVEAQILYREGADVSYTLTGCSSWEGYTLKIHGTKGKLSTVYDCLDSEDYTIVLSPDCAPEQHVPVPREAGRHSGADRRMVSMIFDEHNPDTGPLCLPDLRAGALTVAIGEAVILSSKRGIAVRLSEIFPEMDALPKNGRIMELS